MILISTNQLQVETCGKIRSSILERINSWRYKRVLHSWHMSNLPGMKPNLLATFFHQPCLPQDLYWPLASGTRDMSSVQMWHPQSLGCWGKPAACRGGSCQSQWPHLELFHAASKVQVISTAVAMSVARCCRNNCCVPFREACSWPGVSWYHPQIWAECQPKLTHAWRKNCS